jgi:hypothetical protein
MNSFRRTTYKLKILQSGQQVKKKKKEKSFLSGSKVQSGPALSRESKARVN